MIDGDEDDNYWWCYGGSFLFETNGQDSGQLTTHLVRHGLQIRILADWWQRKLIGNGVRVSLAADNPHTALLIANRNITPAIPGARTLYTHHFQTRSHNIANIAISRYHNFLLPSYIRLNTLLAYHCDIPIRFVSNGVLASLPQSSCNRINGN